MFLGNFETTIVNRSYLRLNTTPDSTPIYTIYDEDGTIIKTSSCSGSGEEYYVEIAANTGVIGSGPETLTTGHRYIIKFVALINTGSFIDEDSFTYGVSGGLTASDVWGYNTRSLTDKDGFAPTAADIWGYATRTLTDNLTAQQVWEYSIRSLTDKLGFAPSSSDIWAFATRTLSDKTGFLLDITYDAAKTAASQTSVNSIPTNPLLTNDLRLNNLDAPISGINPGATAQQVWEYATRSLTDKAGFSLDSSYDPAKTASSQTSVNSIPTNPLLTNDLRLNNLDAPISGITPGTTAQQVWEYVTRTLTSGGGGATPQQIWEYTTRTLTSDTSNIVAIKTAVDMLLRTSLIGYKGDIGNIFSRVSGVFSGYIDFYGCTLSEFTTNPTNPTGFLICTLNSSGVMSNTTNLNVNYEVLYMKLRQFYVESDTVVNIYNNTYKNNLKVYLPKDISTANNNDPYYPSPNGEILRSFGGNGLYALTDSSVASLQKMVEALKTSVDNYAISNSDILIIE